MRDKKNCRKKREKDREDKTEYITEGKERKEIKIRKKEGMRREGKIKQLRDEKKNL